MANKGKKFEEVFEKSWRESFPNSFIYRLKDQMSFYGNSVSSNPCDYICFTHGKLFLMECKETQDVRFSLKFRQYEQLLSYKDIPNVIPGVTIWFASTHGKLFLMECKETQDVRFSLKFRQYEQLLSYKDIPNVIPGVTIWFASRDLIVWVSIQECEKILNDGIKSISLKMIDNGEYDIKIIPSSKKRVYSYGDYSLLKDI